MRGKQVDRIFLGIVAILLAEGLLIFTSASLGLLARTGATFSSVALKQFLAVAIGCLICFLASKVHYTFWRRWSFYILLLSIFLTLLVFIPKIGLEFGGAKRWIILGPITFQPAEILKVTFVIYTAARLSGVKDKVATFKRGVLPTVIIITIAGVILLLPSVLDKFSVEVLVKASKSFPIFRNRSAIPSSPWRRKNSVLSEARFSYCYSYFLP